jgi:hypothetical protein
MRYIFASNGARALRRAATRKEETEAEVVEVEEEIDDEFCDRTTAPPICA